MSNLSIYEKAIRYEKQKAQIKKWKSDNPEKVRETNKRLYQENRAQRLSYQKQYDLDNKEKRKEYMKKYYQDNKKSLIEYQRERRKK